MFYTVKNEDKKITLLIEVRATTKASNNSIRGVKNNELLVNVTASPENNKANSAIIELLSKKIKVPKSSMNIISGKKCRNKRISIDLSCYKGIEISVIQQSLDSFLVI